MKSTILIALLAATALGQSYLYVPNATIPTAAGNLLPFGSYGPILAGCTFMEVVPAAMMDPSNRVVEDCAFVPPGTGSWTANAVSFALGHVATPQPCPFTFPTISGGVVTNLGSFLDLTVMFSSDLHGPFVWPLTLDTWSPMGFPGLSGNKFTWNGINDVAFFATYQASTVTAAGSGAMRQSQTMPPARSLAYGYNAASTTGTGGICAGAGGLYLRLQVLPTAGFYPEFVATPAVGPAPLAVAFTDTSYTSDPGGITTWAWDFQNDGIDDAFTANPTFTYTCPGTYSVKLTVSDASHPPGTRVKSNLIHAAVNLFQLSTAGGGVGNLTITPVPLTCFPTAVHGYTLVSFATGIGPPGNGPLLGLYPDTVTMQFLMTPPAVGNPVHFFVNGVNYPDGGPLLFPAGTFSPLAGNFMDAMEVALSPTWTIVLASNVARVQF